MRGKKADKKLLRMFGLSEEDLTKLLVVEKGSESSGILIGDEYYKFTAFKGAKLNFAALNEFLATKGNA